MMANLVNNQMLRNPLPVVGGRRYPKLLHVSPAHVTSSRRVSLALPETMSAHTTLGYEQKLFSDGHHVTPKWNFSHLHSLQHLYLMQMEMEMEGEEQKKRIEVLKEQVKMMLEQQVKLEDQLELIDTLQRLGISYHFEEKIQSILYGIYSRRRDGSSDQMPGEQDYLYAKALEFRLLRQHGFYVSPDVFDCFKDDDGAFKTSLCGDPKGMLYLYEASYLESKNDGSSLDLAREFTAKYLRKKLDENGFEDETILAELVGHSLEIPLHWRMKRLEARWFVQHYEKTPDMNPILLELAKSDFDFVQKSHQDELNYVAGWWKSTGMGEAMKFARDILVENFLWNIGILCGPEHKYCRIMGTKVAIMITIIDDIYDAYATLDELQLFTAAIQRWDVKSIDGLPHYMKLGFLALHSLVNEVAYDALKLQGVNTIPYVTKAWADLCKAYLQEAKWYESGYIPKMEEYLKNAWISVSAPLFLLHVYIFASDQIRKEDLEHFSESDNIIRPSALIVRLTNDLGTSPLGEKLKSGDISKSIGCHMKENGGSEEKAREHIKMLISDAWREMNTSRLENSDLSSKFRETALNFARAAHCMYQHGDGHGYQNSAMDNHIAALLFHPITVPISK